MAWSADSASLKSKVSKESPALARSPLPCTHPAPAEARRFKAETLSATPGNPGSFIPLIADVQMDRASIKCNGFHVAKQVFLKGVNTFSLDFNNRC